MGKGAQGLIVGVETLSLSHRQTIIELAAKHRLPAMYSAREFVESGGLASYGVSYPDLYYRAADYVDRIFKGAAPAELPIERPSKFALAINRRTARALGIVMPPDLLLRADWSLGKGFSRQTGRGMRPTGTSISTGRSMSIARRTSAPTSVGAVARSPATPKASASFMKSGLTRAAPWLPPHASSKLPYTMGGPPGGAGLPPHTPGSRRFIDAGQGE